MDEVTLLPSNLFQQVIFICSLRSALWLTARRWYFRSNICRNGLKGSFRFLGCIGLLARGFCCGWCLCGLGAHHNTVELKRNEWWVEIRTQALNIGVGWLKSNRSMGSRAQSLRIWHVKRQPKLNWHGNTMFYVLIFNSLRVDDQNQMLARQEE